MPLIESAFVMLCWSFTPFFHPFRCNASLRRLNNHGQTPYDVAEASGCSSMLSLLAAHGGTGRGGLNTRSASGLDTFS